jgi:hypothetical protein
MLVNGVTRVELSGYANAGFLDDIEIVYKYGFVFHQTFSYRHQKAKPQPCNLISAIGLLPISGVAVAIINSRTLKGKQIDAQLKKDEQSYGYNMEYLHHKPDCGVKRNGYSTQHVL